MGEEGWNDHGRYDPIHSEEEMRKVVREYESGRTQEVEGEIEIPRQSAEYRLRRLEEYGQISTKKVRRSLAWSVVGEE